MRISRTQSSAFTSPSLHLRMFKLSNPWVQWAIAHGAYQDTAKRTPHVADAGDPESLALARQLGMRMESDPVKRYQEM